MDFQSFRDINWNLMFIRAYTWLSTMYNLVSNQTVKSVTYLTYSFLPEVYCLYSGSSVPVRIQDYRKDVAGTGSVDFYYNRDTKVISKTLNTNQLPRTLNIEGASIYHGDICLYDLTDFFDTTRFAGAQYLPTLDQWVGIWELENGIYLDRKKNFQIRVEFLGETSETFQLWDSTQTRWSQLTSNIPRLHHQGLRPALTNCSCAPASVSRITPEELPSLTVTTDLSGNRVVDLSGAQVIIDKSEEVAETSDQVEEEEVQT
jgi:hypothetical protein